MALPDFLDLDDPTRNLASSLEATEVNTPLVSPPQVKHYFAWDGTPLGVGTDCDPLTDERSLSELELVGGPGPWAAGGALAGWCIAARMQRNPWVGLAAGAALGALVGRR